MYHFLHFRYEQSHHKAKLEKKYLVDYPDELFTGRNDELHQLHTSLHRNADKSQNTILSQTTIIVGLGGIGKTQLVRKYAQKYEHEHQHIIWINTETLRYSFQQVAKKLDITTSTDDTASIVENVYHHLSSDNCLFIFDNAEIDDVFHFLPWKSYDNSYPIPFILITSRNNEWNAIQVEIVQLKELQMNEAIDFIKKGLLILDDSQLQDIEDLVGFLQFYPLVMRQAIAYIQIEKKTKNSKFTVGDYVRRYQEQAGKLLDFSFKGFKYGDSTIRTLQLSLEKIENNDQCGNTAMTILYVIGYLAPMSFQRESLKHLTSENEDGLEELKAAVSLLVQYCVVFSECGGEEIISVHRVVQEVIRIHVKEKDEPQEEITLTQTLQLLSDGFLESESTAHIAHVWKYASKCKNLVRKHYDRDVATYRYNTVDGYTTLHFLVREAKYNEIEAILSHLSEEQAFLIKAIHATDKYENSPLHVAARDGHLKIVQLLIDKGADVNVTNSDGQSPLHLAVRRNNCMEMVELLVSNHADVNSIDKNGMPLVFITFCHCPYDKAQITWTKSNGRWHIKTIGPKYMINLQVVDVPIQSDVLDETDLATNLLQNLKMSHFEKAFDIIQQIVLAIDFGTQMQMNIEPIASLEAPSNVSNSELMVNILSDLENATRSVNSTLKMSEDIHFSKVLRRLKKSETFLVFECTPKVSNMNVEKLKVVEYLIESGAKLNEAIQKSRFRCLPWAAQNNETKIFKFFLDNGADVNSDMNGNTSLMAAVDNENVDIVKLIIDRPEADVNFCSGIGMTPLHTATLKNNFCIVKLLLNRGANINAVWVKLTPPTIANDLGFREILRLFIEHGADPNNCSAYLESPLHNAAKHGDFEFVKYLVDKSANVNAQNKGQFTPLHYSVRLNNFEITEFLFRNGADPKIPHWNGVTPMQSAARICNIKMLRLFGVSSPESYASSENFKLLIENWTMKESEVLQSFFKETMKNVKNIQEYTNACDMDGNTPLMWAVRNSSMLAAQVLLEYGADVNIKNARKETALHWAVNYIQPEFVLLLIENNINPCKDINGKTPFNIALEMLSEKPSDQKIEEIFGLLSLQNDSKSMFCWLREHLYKLIILFPLILVLIYYFIQYVCVFFFS